MSNQSIKAFHDAQLTPDEMKVLLEYRRKREINNIDKLTEITQCNLHDKVNALHVYLIQNKEVSQHIIDSMHEKIDEYAMHLRDFLKFTEDYPNE